eukprot:517802-Pleurochrysis_carterae.AAC.3
MEVLGLLRDEDDNPRGQGRGLFVSGATLEEVEAAEERRKQIQAERLSFAKQETGILKLVQSKNHFLRLGLPEPRWDSQGNPIWDCSERALTRVYDEAKKCCHPEWSFHPRRKQGFELLTEAYDTLSDRNGKRDEYVRKVVNEVHALLRILLCFEYCESILTRPFFLSFQSCCRLASQARERERLLEELQKGKLDGQVSTNSRSTDDAAELREQVQALQLSLF